MSGFVCLFIPTLALEAILEKFVEVLGRDSRPSKNDSSLEIHYDGLEMAGLIPLTDAVLAVVIDAGRVRSRKRPRLRATCPEPASTAACGYGAFATEQNRS